MSPTLFAAPMRKWSWPTLKTDQIAVLITLVTLMGGVIYGYATLNYAVAETGRVLSKIESRMEADSNKLDKIHDHGIEMDYRLRELERKAGLLVDRDAERK